MGGIGDGGGRRDREKHYRQAALAHPLRQRIAHLMFDGREAGSREIAAELEESPGRIAYHLRVLLRREALTVIPRRRPAPPLYRWSPGAQWARKMLGGESE